MADGETTVTATVPAAPSGVAETVAAAETVVAAAEAAVSLAETRAAQTVADSNADITELKETCRALKTEMETILSRLTSTEETAAAIAKLENQLAELSAALQSLTRQEQREEAQIAQAAEVVAEALPTPENESGDGLPAAETSQQPQRKRRRLI